MLGVTIDIDGQKLHTFNDLKLKWYSVEISSPDPKTYTIDVPGMDGELDLTESLIGDIKYNNRKIVLKFEVDGDFYDWSTISSKINNFCHGKKANIILDTDINYYWQGRVTLNSTKEDYSYGELELKIDADPYKYEVYGGLDKWKWDTFNFEDGIIREYKDLEVNSTLTVIIPGRRKTIYPYFTTSIGLQVVFEGVTYTLPLGTSQVLGIALKEGDNILTFIGGGKVSIDYRGGSL